MRFKPTFCFSVLCGLGVFTSAIHAQNAAKPSAAQEAKTGATTANGSIPLESAQPKPLKPATDETAQKSVKAGDEAIITSKGTAFFDTKQSVGVFTKDVIVVHPQFHLTCEELQVFMLKEGEKPIQGDRKNAADQAIMRRQTPLPGEEPEPQPDSSIREAIAKGPKVVIQKQSEEGEVQVGICRHATYIGATGDIVMRDYPQLQRGSNLIIATDPSTVITIKQSGKISTDGPNRVQIIQSDGGKKKMGDGIVPHAAPPVGDHLPQPKLSSPKRN